MTSIDMMLVVVVMVPRMILTTFGCGWKEDTFPMDEILPLRLPELIVPVPLRHEEHWDHSLRCDFDEYYYLK
jgi:hypothetical protein